MQQEIKEHGLKSFVLVILRVIKFPPGLSKDYRRAILRKAEQEFKGIFPIEQQYPGNRASGKSK
jgi:hypothetical protein